MDFCRRTTTAPPGATSAKTRWAWGPPALEDPSIGLTANDSLIAGVSVGLNVSTDVGCNWNCQGGPLSAVPIADIAVRPDSPASAVAITKEFVQTDSATQETISQVHQEVGHRRAVPRDPRDELWACSAEVSGFIAGVSTDDGATFTAKLPLLGALTGPIACAPNQGEAGVACHASANASECGPAYQTFCGYYGCGIPEGGAGSSSGSGGSGTGDAEGKPSGSSSTCNVSFVGICGCGGGAIFAGSVAIAAVAIRRRRKRPR